MPYIENPKTKGSGILCAIPQTGTCPVGCGDCFFQSGRSYLEPLDKNLPNMPDPAVVQHGRYVVRVNDGNDSNVDRETVVEAALAYRDVFFNTSIPRDLAGFGAPVVLTLNPGRITDTGWNKIEVPPRNLMFVRFRANTWNTGNLDAAIQHYTERNVPVVVTFMAYYGETIPAGHEIFYSFRKRTLNSYWVIEPAAADRIMGPHRDNPLVYTCGKDVKTFSCSRCGNCLREYYATRERMRG